MQDIYAGPGLAGVARGTVKKLRVVALDFRAALLGGNGNGGPAGGAFVATPVAVGNGCWDPKIVLGETPVHEDGSAQFIVPGPDAGLFPGRRRAGLRRADDAQLVDASAGRERLRASVATSRRTAFRPPIALPWPDAGRRSRWSRSMGRRADSASPRKSSRSWIGTASRCHNDREKLPHRRGRAAGRRAAESQAAIARQDGGTVVQPAWRRESRCRGQTPLERRLPGAHGLPSRNRAAARFSRQAGPLVNWVSPQSAPPMLPPIRPARPRAD